MTEEKNDKSPRSELFELAQLRSVPLDELIADHSVIETHSVASQIRSRLKANEEAPWFEAAKFLLSILEVSEHYKDPAKPFGPVLVLADGRRSLAPEDISGEQNDILLELLPDLSNTTLRTKISHIVWYNDRKQRIAADIAIDGYTELVNATLDGERKFNIGDESKLDHRIFELLYTAFQISQSIRGKREHKEEVLGVFKRLYKESFDAEGCASAERIVEIALDFQLCDEASLAEQIENKLPAHSHDDTYWQKKLLEQLVRLYRRNGIQDEANNCQMRIAECSIATAEAMGGSAMGAASWLMTAIQELRQARGSEAKRRAAEVRTMLRDRQSDAIFEMGHFSHGEDISDLVKATLERAEPLSMPDTLAYLADVHRSPDPEKLFELARETAQQFPLSSMFPAVHVDYEGKHVSKSDGVSSFGGDDDATLMDIILRDQNLHRNVVVSSAIEPLRRHIQLNYSPIDHALDVITSNSPFVPRFHKDLFLLGFSRFFQGDMISAANILIPQMENSLRYVLLTAGKDSSTIESDLTQDDRSISSLLAHEREQLETIFGENITFEIDILFNMRPGPALRHEIAHGKIPAAHFYSEDVRYACWFIYRLVCIPLFDHWEEISAYIQDDL